LSSPFACDSGFPIMRVLSAAISSAHTSIVAVALAQRRALRDAALL
jgi:hypothetical protein